MIRQWRKITNSSKISLYCPICEDTHEIKFNQGISGYLNGDDNFNVDEQWFVCEETDYEFVNGEMLEYNLNNIRNKIKGE